MTSTELDAHASPRGQPPAAGSPPGFPAGSQGPSASLPPRAPPRHQLIALRALPRPPPLASPPNPLPPGPANHPWEKDNLPFGGPRQGDVTV
ncbi:hypothetical protein Aspvir_009115 [Aspergillus viridinutans]|uniref:Uncharacterized protein n=1 Tax=Aspergillus viridinutans TaxID=75553 RepID=A0A9P3C4G5_ASPVI|nr:uncharacterized protein Aspvir_009115 [Aspergillus viridinutans]GIK05016.1 hypothetical protein Aspvir_009115 [Aspergillus viridinutans]